MTSNNKDLTGSTISIEGKVVEHLKLGNKEWITILFPDSKKITINLKYCTLNENKQSN